MEKKSLLLRLSLMKNMINWLSSMQLLKNMYCKIQKKKRVQNRRRIPLLIQQSVNF